MNDTKDPLIEALDYAIAVLPDLIWEGNLGQVIATLTAHRDSLAARPIVGEVEGKPVRLGDVLMWHAGANWHPGSFVVVGADDSHLATIRPQHLARCRLPTAADFGGAK
jgi:ribosomal protein L27